MISPSGMALRPLVADDAGTIASWGDDPVFCAEAEWKCGIPTEEREQFLDHLIRQPPSELLRLGVTFQGTLVGYVDLHGTHPGRRELGYVIGNRAYWGRGFGTRAAAAALDYGFGQLKLQEIWAEALDANEKSVRILQRLGMRETGRGTDGIFLAGRTFYRQFAIARAEWQSTSPAARPPSSSLSSSHSCTKS